MKPTLSYSRRASVRSARVSSRTVVARPAGRRLRRRRAAADPHRGERDVGDGREEHQRQRLEQPGADRVDHECADEDATPRPVRLESSYSCSNGVMSVVAHQPSMLDLAAEATLGPLTGHVRRHELSRGAWIDHLPGWVLGSDLVLQTLRDEVDWRAERRRMYDGE